MNAYISKPQFDDGLYHVYEIPFDLGPHEVTIIEQPYIDTFISKSGTKYFEIKLPVTDYSFDFWEDEESEEDFSDWYCEVSIQEKDLRHVMEEYNVNDDITIHVYKDSSGRKRAVVKLN